MTDPSKVSNDLGLLAPKFAAAVQAALDECHQADLAGGMLDAKVFEAFRSGERQAWLYAQGRTRPGNIVTNARTNLTSWHGYGLAVDVIHRTGLWAPYGTDGKANEAWFKRVAQVFKKHGCNWGGDWKHPDTPHMQWGKCSASPSADAQAMIVDKGVQAVWAAVGAV